MIWTSECTAWMTAAIAWGVGASLAAQLGESLILGLALFSSMLATASIVTTARLAYLRAKALTPEPRR